MSSSLAALQSPELNRMPKCKLAYTDLRALVDDNERVRADSDQSRYAASLLTRSGRLTNQRRSSFPTPESAY